MLKTALYRTVPLAACVVFAMSGIRAPAAETSGAAATIWRTDFSHGVADWINERPENTTLQADGLGTSTPSLRAQLLTPGATRYLYGPAFTVAQTDSFARSRRIVLRGKIRAAGSKELQAEIKLLGSKEQNRIWVGVQKPKGSSAHLLPLPGEWQSFERTFALPEGISSFRPYLCLSGEPGTVWLAGLEAHLEVTRGHRITGGENGIFFADRGQIKIEFVDPATNPVGTIRLLDEREQMLREQPIPAGTAEVIVDLPGRGFYKLVVNCRYPDGKVIETITTAAVAGTPLPSAKRIGSRYGLMDVHGDTTQAARLGAYWNWGFFNYSSCKQNADGEPAELPAQPQKVANPERQIIQAGHGETPQWLNPQQNKKGLYPPKDWAKFEKMVTLWAKAQTNLPKIVTVYNEPDAHWRGSTEELVQYHAAVARGIRAGRPGTAVMGPCMYGIRMPYLKNLVNLGLLNDLDGVVMHAYVDGTPPEDEFIARILELKDYLKFCGKENLPLYLTEFGWSTRQGTWQKPVDERTQARYVTRSLALLSSIQINGLVYFCYQYNCDNPGEQGFSLLDEHNRPKPSLCAFSTLTRWLTGVRGETRWLRLAPQTHLILGEDAESVIAVLWNTAREAEVSLPFTPAAAEDYLGRPVALQGNTVRLSPDPLFLRLREPTLMRIQLLPALRVIRGNTLTLPRPAQVIPAPLQQQGQQLLAPANAPAGEYLLLSRENGAWSGQPVQVASPLSIEEITPRWPLSGTPEIAVSIRSHLQEKTGGDLTLSSGKTTLHASKPALEANRLTSITIPLPERKATSAILRLQLPLQSGQSVQDVVTAPVDLRFLGASFPGDAPLPEADSASWLRFGEFPARPAGTPVDCSARLRAEYGPDGLHLFLRVEDDEHRQSAGPEATWAEDSVQIGFDVDAQKEWQPNNLGFGFNGHRVFEYTVALTTRGPEVWRNIAYDPTLRPGLPESRVSAKIRREDSSTVYDLLFPWTTMGLEQVPQRGSALGFALAVNDKDHAGRHGLQLFGGIIESKSPESFGKLWLR